MIGQEVHVVKASGTNTNEVTPDDTLGAYAAVDIAAVGDNCLLRWSGSSWSIVSTSAGAAAASDAGTGVAIQNS